LLASVVKVYCVAAPHNHQQPWQRKHQTQSSGSGFILDTNHRLIVTNAHVTLDATFIEVRRHGLPARYQAEALYVGHACDLALLTVEDDSFWTDLPTTPLELGDIPQLQDEVKVVGYPTGGDQISITSGVVSRIEQQPYSHAMLSQNLLAIQIDAAINPGNSGGPVLFKNKVVGVAFQSLGGAENIGFIIPTAIVNRFMEGYWRSRPRDDGARPQYFPGFCSLGIYCQAAIHEGLRAYLQMTPEQTGVVVFDLMPTSAANGLLFPMDVLMEIDGQPIGNDGTLVFRNREHIRFDHLMAMKSEGDTAVFRVLRAGQELDVTVETLLYRNLAINHYENTWGPAFVVLGGMVFSELSMGYLCEWGDWYHHAPRRLTHLAIYGRKSEPAEQPVILTSILLHKINKGYNNQAEAPYTECRVIKLNDTPLTNLKHMVQLWQANTAPYVILELEDNRRIIMNYADCQKYNPEIMKKYGVPAQASQELLPLLEPH
jgi:S1-C subfamily serine protease